MLENTKDFSEFQASTSNLPSPADDLSSGFRLRAGMAQAADAWRLSGRQRQVLALSARGFTNRQMACELGCQPKTIELHITALLKKAGVARRNELLAKLMHAYA